MSINKFNPHSIIGVVLPTNEPDPAFELLLPSLGFMKETAPISTFLINFQKPWTESLMNEYVRKIKDYGFDVKYKFSEYDISNGVPLCKIRNDTASLMKNAMYYSYLDDDMRACGPSSKINKTTGHQMIDCIHYLFTHDKCGLVLIGGSLIRKIKMNHIAPVWIERAAFQTGKGYILKNLYPLGLTHPFDSEHIVGAGEESISAGMIVSNGYYPAKLPFGRTMHFENVGKSKGKKFYKGCEMYDWYNYENMTNNYGDYIRSHYNPSFKVRKLDVVSKDLYYNNGGIDIYNSEIADSLDVDYSNSKVSDMISEILRLSNDRYTKELSNS